MALEEILSTRRAERIRRHVGDALGCGGLDAFVSHLRARGHSTATVAEYLRVAVRFCHWLRSKRIDPEALTEEVLLRFLGQAAPYLRRRGASLRHLLHALRIYGLAPVKPAADASRNSTITHAYGAYLRDHRGLKHATIAWHVGYVRDLLAHVGAHSIADLHRLSAADIRAFVSVRAHRYTPGALKNVAKALRSFLRFLEVEARLPVAALIAAVPSIAEYKLSGLPSYLNDDQLRDVLASFDRSTAIGRRDHAIARFIVDLGLRSIEVAELSLDSVRWRAGTICLRATKGSRSSELPLPHSTGKALVAYLQRGRPRTTTRQIFVQHRAPVGAPLLAGSIGAAMRRGLKRAGVRVARNGAHALRHTAATRLIRSGASIKEIADILRHRSIDTTAIYAKVDLPRLRQVALPWPSASGKLS